MPLALDLPAGLERRTGEREFGCREGEIQTFFVAEAAVVGVELPTLGGVHTHGCACPANTLVFTRSFRVWVTFQLCPCVYHPRTLWLSALPPQSCVYAQAIRVMYIL